MTATTEAEGATSGISGVSSSQDSFGCEGVPGAEPAARWLRDLGLADDAALAPLTDENLRNVDCLAGGGGGGG